MLVISTPSNEIRLTNSVLTLFSVLVKRCSILVQCSSRPGSRPAEEAEAEMAAKREGIATNDASSGPSPAEPQVAPPPWQRLPNRPGRRRREPISREAIVTAAIQLLDREGLAALSMRRLAEELGTGAASLYWHVGSKDGLLDLVFDELIGEEQIPDPDPSRWQEQLKDIARAQRRVSLRHPYLVRISIGRIPMGPNALRFSERVIAILRAGGLPPRLAVQGYLVLIATVNGFTVDETGVEDSGAEDSGGSALALPTDPASQQEVADMARDYIASLPTEQFPNMVGLAGEFAFSDAD